MGLQPAARREGGALRDDGQPSHRYRAVAHHEQQGVARGRGKMHVAVVSFRGESGQKYLVHVKGGLVPTYSLALQSLTADLGTTVHAEPSQRYGRTRPVAPRIVTARADT